MYRPAHTVHKRGSGINLTGASQTHPQLVCTAHWHFPYVIKHIHNKQQATPAGQADSVVILLLDRGQPAVPTFQSATPSKTGQPLSRPALEAGAVRHSMAQVRKVWRRLSLSGPRHGRRQRHRNGRVWHNVHPRTCQQHRQMSPDMEPPTSIHPEHSLPQQSTWFAEQEGEFCLERT